jgi:UDP-3-O-[3-hydroxymyristoyl] glucosamine N-acyltransferase
MKFARAYALQEIFPGAHSFDNPIMVSGVSPPHAAAEQDLVIFFKPPPEALQHKARQAAAWLIPVGSLVQQPHPPCFFVEKPRYEMIFILQRYLALQEESQKQAEISLTAHISPSAQIGDNVSIGPYAVIEDDVVIGSNCVIGPHCVVGRRTTLDSDVIIHAHSHLYSDVHIGAETTVYSHTVIGMPGFGFEFEEGRWLPIPHCGGVHIGQRCVIGSHVSIAAGVIEPTIIGDDVILDNHIHIAHQVHIKQGNAIAACVGIAGSTTIEPYCQIAGGTMISGHLTIGPQVQITGMSMVNKSLQEPGRYSSGWPVEPNALWRRKVASLNRLPQHLKAQRVEGAHHE